MNRRYYCFINFAQLFSSYTIEGLYGDAQPGEYSLSWNTIGKKTLVSGVLDFPNEIRKNERINLTNKGREISELVVNASHDLKNGCTVLSLEKR